MNLIRGVAKGGDMGVPPLAQNFWLFFSKILTKWRSSEYGQRFRTLKPPSP